MFVSGSLGLDFLNTLATPVDTQVDWIDDGDGLLSWLAQAQLVPAKVLKEMKTLAMPGEFTRWSATRDCARVWIGGIRRSNKSCSCICLS